MMGRHAQRHTGTQKRHASVMRASQFFNASARRLGSRLVDAVGVGCSGRFHMSDPYTAVGLIPTVRGVRKRAEIQRNLEHISHLIAAATWLSSLDLPVRLVLLPEGALQGFTDEVFDLDHVTYANESAIDVPGPETDYLGQL